MQKDFGDSRFEYQKGWPMKRIKVIALMLVLTPLVIVGAVVFVTVMAIADEL